MLFSRMMLALGLPILILLGTCQAHSQKVSVSQWLGNDCRGLPDHRPHELKTGECKTGSQLQASVMLITLSSHRKYTTNWLPDALAGTIQCSAHLFSQPGCSGDVFTYPIPGVIDKCLTDMVPVGIRSFMWNCVPAHLPLLDEDPFLIVENDTAASFESVFKRFDSVKKVYTNPWNHQDACFSCTAGPGKEFHCLNDAFQDGCLPVAATTFTTTTVAGPTTTATTTTTVNAGIMRRDVLWDMEHIVRIQHPFYGGSVCALARWHREKPSNKQKITFRGPVACKNNAIDANPKVVATSTIRLSGPEMTSTKTVFTTVPVTTITEIALSRTSSTITLQSTRTFTTTVSSTVVDFVTVSVFNSAVTEVVHSSETLVVTTPSTSTTVVPATTSTVLVASSTTVVRPVASTTTTTFAATITV